MPLVSIDLPPFVYWFYGVLVFYMVWKLKEFVYQDKRRKLKFTFQSKKDRKHD